jgi:uroporphyrinogen-III synthase
MSSALQGRTVALAEGRQLEELTHLLEKEGARPLPCPLVNILDAPDRAAVAAWLRDLAAGQFAWVIFMTGEAWRRLLPIAEQEGMREAVLAGLRAARLVCRGPKPVQALREVGLTPYLTVQPPTTEGVLAALRRQELRGQTVGLTLYGQPNKPLEEFLEEAGAIVRPVLPYVYAPAADEERVVDLIHQLDAGAVDAIIFTSSPQVERLFEVATARSLKVALQRGLARTCVAAVGPVVAEDLHQHGVKVSVCPEQGFVMKNLVSLLRRSWERKPETSA